MALRTELLHYFQLEKSWTTGLAVFGVAALALAVWLWFMKGPYRGAALPLGLLALFELGVGAGVALRTPRQVTELIARIDDNQDLAAESTRMKGVMRAFEI